jgi:hypothetical protein
MSDDGRERLQLVVITGGLGNLGTKLCRHLLRHANGGSSSSPYKVILVEVNEIIEMNRWSPIALPPRLPSKRVAQTDL